MEISPRKQPRQARGQATCAAIRQAAARILVNQGMAAVNTNSVADLAGVSVGTLYQYYPSKEAILAELVRALRAGMLDDLRAGADRSAGLNLQGTVMEMVTASLAHHARSPALAEALERVETTLPMDAETARLKAEIEHLVVGLLSRFDLSRPDVAARDLAAITRAMAEAAVRAGETDFSDVARRAARAAMGYLTGPDPAAEI